MILADEPTGNLGAASARDVLTLLGRLNKEFGKTLVMVTHDPGAAKTASTIRYLEKGSYCRKGKDLPNKAHRKGHDFRHWRTRFCRVKIATFLITYA